MQGQHHYATTITWTGNRGTGTSGYRAYDRAHTVAVGGKPDILGSSDPAFRGDGTRHNPEDMLVASLSSCHMLWYLHLCSDAGVIVTAYTDHATGIMVETPDGGGEFTEVTLHPVVTVAHADMTNKAQELHDAAHKLCFIARSVRFLVRHVCEVLVAGEI